jgi:MFS family permease
MATFSIGYQLGAAIGAPVFGFIIDQLGFGGMYIGAMICLGVGLVATALHWPALTRPLHAGIEGASRT